MNALTSGRRQWLRWSLGAGAALGAPQSGFSANAAIPPPGQAADWMIWRERRMQGLGTHLRLQAGHAAGGAGIETAMTESKLDAALDAAVQAIRHVERQFSLFDANSALSRLNRDGVLHQPHPDFVHLLRVAQTISAQSQGHFDVTVQPLWQVWYHAQTQGRLPTPQEISQAKAHVGWRKLEVSTDKIRFLQPGMGITLNGIAQGFAGDLAQAALQAHGVEHALLDTGEWTMRGQAPGGETWQLGLQNPRAQPPGAAGAAATPLLARLTTDGRAVATSSDVNLRFDANGTHHHIFDPATGYSPRVLASVTVLAASGVMADALTKVMFMGSVADALRWARRWGVDVVAIDKSGRWRASEGLRNQLKA